MTTIYALSSGRGRAGIAVVRVSGPQAGAAADALLGQRPAPRVAQAAELRDAEGGAIDHGLALWFPGPASATGEDVVEFHVHGGAAVVQALYRALAAVPGLRMAEAGEFTRRAFANGKLDLTQVEAIADLIAAETEGQRRQAARQLDGALGRTLAAWRSRLLQALAQIEAAIDFADEDGVPADVLAATEAAVAGLLPGMDAAMAGAVRGERLRSGVHVVLAGAPNVGKSSIINRLVQRDAAIVAPEAGTTRDIVEVHLDIGGVPFVIADTAGLRVAAGGVEQEGVRRAAARAESADIRVAVFDGKLWPELHPETLALVDDRTVAVLNKADCMQFVPDAPTIAGRPAVVLSAATGLGFAALTAALLERAGVDAGAEDAPALTRGRHREALAAAAGHLRRFLSPPDPQALELRAEDLRLAVRDLGRITGKVDVEDILDVVFSEFCIGK